MKSPFNVLTWSQICLIMVVGESLISTEVCAQSGIRESLERLDRNENGLIEPDEVTPLARPFLERITGSRKLSLEKPIAVDKLQEAARIHFALANGVAGTKVRPAGESTVKPFGPDADQPMVPEFGLADVKYPYIQSDLNEADATLRRSDANRDTYIDRAEAAPAKWTHRNPFDDDLNKDDRLSRLELAQRYARRRLLSAASDELVQKYRRTGGDVRPSVKEERKEDRSQWWKRGGSSHWLTASMMGRFDANRNGRLELHEAQALGIPLGRIDVDRNGELTREELHVLVSEMQDEAGDLTAGLPGWFYELDADKDGQVALHEFATELTIAQREEFAALDINEDGLLTDLEVIQSKAVVGGSYRNDTAEILPPHRTIISEIEIDDDFLIRDLNVHLSITHSNTGFLDGYLTGPDGQRVELFAEVGGQGDHFDQTVFDDQATTLIVKAKPPFTGSFLPSGLINRQPGLHSFNGKSVKGVWQLVVRGTRSERFGMLHSWGMTFEPLEHEPGHTQPPPAQESSANVESSSTAGPEGEGSLLPDFLQPIGQ